MIGKKSQAEIIGLVIIILLITIGLLFFVRFVVLNPKQDAKGSYVDSELASNMINVLLKTTTDCKKSSMTELFQDCAGFKRIECNDGMDSCAKIQQVSGEIFNKTLEEWRKPYSFKAYIIGGATIDERGNCSANADRVSKTYPVPTDRGTLFITLDICS